jgi:hypothetical protein
MSISKEKQDLISALPLKHLNDIPPSTELPASFAKIHPPRFECGFRVRWADVGQPCQGVPPNGIVRES